MPRDSEFTDLSEPLERSASYNLCVLGSVGIGLAIGRFAGVPGLVVGGAVGLVVGLKMCPTVAPAIRKKLFTPNARLAPHEFRQLVRDIKRANPRMSTEAVLDHIAAERLSVLGGPPRTSA